MWTILNYVKLFFIDLYLAVKYKAFEFDDQMRLTKTNTQRIMIWIGISIVSLVATYFILRAIGSMLLSITRYQEKIIPQ